MLDRGLTAEQVEDAVEQLQQNWELAAIFDFLQVIACPAVAEPKVVMPAASLSYPALFSLQCSLGSSTGLPPL